MKWELMSMICNIRHCPRLFLRLRVFLWGRFRAPPCHLRSCMCPRFLLAFRREDSEQGRTWRTLITCMAFPWELVRRKWKIYHHVGIVTEIVTEIVTVIGIRIVQVGMATHLRAEAAMTQTTMTKMTMTTTTILMKTTRRKKRVVQSRLKRKS